MSEPWPRLMNASTPMHLIDALCDFIEFWLGPRNEEYGELAKEVETCSLPMPLRNLYQFAGRWPGFDKRRESKWGVGAFSCQDSLRPLHCLEMDERRRITFIDENQGCWTCLTLADGDDPPVWCKGDVGFANGEPNQGQKLVCDSLSRFLVTFVLQEITLGSRCCLSDEGLSEQFEATKDRATKLWQNGPYIFTVTIPVSSFGMVCWSPTCGEAICSEPIMKLLFNSCRRIRTIVRIGLMVGIRWRLDIELDGSAKMAFDEWPVDEKAKVPSESFDFEDLKVELSEMTTSSGRPDRNSVVFFQRRVESYSEGQYLSDHQFVFELFKQALEKMSPTNTELERLIQEKWPS